VSDTERAAWRKALDDKHLGPEQLAEREGVPLQTVYGWNKTRTGPRFMKIGRHVRYRLADVIAWEDSRTIASGRAS
jgi:predicted DNA-binding transcriptional regulator AlpA